jgi:hypothetical protein
MFPNGVAKYLRGGFAVHRLPAGTAYFFLVAADHVKLHEICRPAQFGYDGGLH